MSISRFWHKIFCLRMEAGISAGELRRSRETCDGLRHGQTGPIKGRLCSRFWIQFCPILDVSLDIIEHTIIDDNRGGKRPQTRFWILGDFVQSGFYHDFRFHNRGQKRRDNPHRFDRFEDYRRPNTMVGVLTVPLKGSGYLFVRRYGLTDSHSVNMGVRNRSETSSLQPSRGLPNLGC
jgi:hypothetical protein